MKDLGTILDSAPHRKHEDHKAGHHEDHKAGHDHKSHHAGESKKAGAKLQTRRDTTEHIPGEPDYVRPEDWPTQHIEELNKAGGGSV